MAFTVYDGTDLTALASELLAANSGITILDGTIVLNASGQEAVNLYDGSLSALGIGAGLLLTSGTTPGLVNTVEWFGTDNSIWPDTFYNGDADIDAVVNTVFQTQSYDATTLAFDFTVDDPTATSVSFDLVFGSDEFPEWVDQFVDSAIVMVNGVNYALFNHDPLHPLSVVSANLAAGYFQDNAGNVLPIEYDGVSHVLKIIAPINPGEVNHIKIGIADTGDHIYDSGIFLANFSAGNIPGSGVVITPPGTGTDNSDTLTGSSKDEYFDLKDGDDTCYAGAGDDIVVAGGGSDVVYGGSGADQLKGDAGNDSLDGGDGDDTAVFTGASAGYGVAYDVSSGSYTITDSSAAEGVDTLTNVEYAKFGDGLFALGPGGLTPVTPVTPPSNAPGSVVISGIGAVGNVLTATVSDPDGISGVVGYQWQVSDDNGSTWSDIAGADSNTYTVSAADVGMDIQVMASYVDNASIPKAESPVSATKTILDANNGDLVVTLMQLTAPAGTSVINPLTTLLQDAIDLGVTPNMAALAIKTVLGLPAEISLQTYDAFAVLQADPNDAAAVMVEKVAVQVAILTSLSDDDTGVKLTLKILEAAANNLTLDLANLNDLSEILGIPAVLDPVTNKYPQPLDEIYDRNKSMSDAVDDVLAGGGPVGATGLSVIEAEWQDLLSIQDGIDSTSIADLSIHVNQAPTGSATASLANGLEDTTYTVHASDLLQGFSDADGDTLSVSGLSADSGSVTDNGDGTFTFTPAPDFYGPVELTYDVIDGNGGSAPASQLLVVDPANVTLTGTSGANILNGGAGDDTISGLGGDDTLNGLAGNDLLNGGAGNDSLDGGAGNDTMKGGLGDDTYVVDASADVVAESLNAGNDTLYASVTRTLGLNQENLVLTGASAINGTGNALSNSLTGNAAGNILIAGGGNDSLDGGLGNDTLKGGLGDDTYLVDAAGDVVVEGLNAGTDTILSNVTRALGANQENLVLTGTANINGAGNLLANSLTGNAGNNALNGGAGGDVLTGGLGNDIFVFNTALGAGNVDTITDFTSGLERIRLDDDIFAAFDAAVATKLTADQFCIGDGATSAQDSTDRIIYDTSTGALYYDADGLDGAAAVQFAVVGSTTHPSLTASDFVLIA
jgi:Ca2+-binding RTX toxin-like protein